VHDGSIVAADGKPFTDVLNIGIGGSDLGPRMVSMALTWVHGAKIEPHFLSNVDGHAFAQFARELDPARTLVLVASKTFTTLETMTNGHAARDWLAAALGEDAVHHHFAALSTNLKETEKFGIREDRVFGFRDWVGGRYSVWSAVGLVAELTIGSDRFREFLDGASDMDRHFKEAPGASNLPVLMGLVGAWNRTFLGLPTLAVLPYDQRLAQLPAYLQQLEMESNGKSVTRAGERIDYPTAAVVWGAPGSNAQHSFFQMLHQGTPTAALDLIAPLRGSNGNTDAQDLALQNCLAQSQAFAFGHTRAEVDADMAASGASSAEVARLAAHRVYEGNRPSSLLLYPRTTARTLGTLLALYEHSVFVQGVVWDVNSVDQFGVELGKKLAAGISLRGDRPAAGPGAAGLAALIDYVAAHR
jgi:glucose-6-phosphate isomerase